VPQQAQHEGVAEGSPESERPRAGGQRRRYGGFWIRCAAALVDLFIVWAVVKAVVMVFARVGTYVPLELILVLTFLVYSVLMIGLRGGTLGKKAVGLSVRTSSGTAPGLLRAFLRETVFKVISGAFLTFGFLWVAFSRGKRGWHDYLAGTSVVRGGGASRRARLAVVLVLVIIGASVGHRAYQVGSHIRDAAAAAPLRPSAATDHGAEPAPGLEASAVNPADRAAFAQWVESKGQDPADYVIGVASQHQLTVIGERHWVREELLFLNKIIPDLYHRAGVTCIAMEACVREDDAKLEKLVTSERFDNQLAMDIARDEPWEAWGFKEYWDVFKTVWELNQSLPEGARKMRIIGLDLKWDGPSLSLAGITDTAVPGPAWERLRVVRVLDDILLVSVRDELMVRALEKVLQRGEKALAWVGAAHSYPGFYMSAAGKQKGRMGFILHRKYGDRVFQIRLHDAPWDTPAISTLLEQAIERRGNAPVGFGVVGSPFARLQDRESSYFQKLPELRFSGLAQGYLYLKPVEELTRCRWQDGYISEAMFVRNRPYYEAECKQSLKNSEAANRAFAVRPWP